MTGAYIHRERERDMSSEKAKAVVVKVQGEKRRRVKDEAPIKRSIEALSQLLLRALLEARLFLLLLLQSFFLQLQQKREKTHHHGLNSLSTQTRLSRHIPVGRR